MEVPGRTSDSDIFVLGSNDADEDFYCDPCENDGETQPAEGFCEDCQEYLCSSCFKIHRRPLLWRHHVLLDKDAMPKTKTKQEWNYECTEPCLEHSTKIIEYYCQTHDQLGCPICITGNHRTCNDVDYIPHIAKRYGESSEIKGLFDSLECLQEETNEYTGSANNDVLKISEYEKNANARVLQLRDEFNSVCDRLKEDIDSVERSDERKIKDSIRKYEEISRKIKTRVAVLEKKRAEMKMSQLFTEAKLSKLSVVDLAKELELAKENAKIRHYNIDFNVEALRESLKLNFIDDERDTEVLERFNPSGHQSKPTADIPRHVTATGDKSEEQGSSASDGRNLHSNQTAKASRQIGNTCSNKQIVQELYTEEKQQVEAPPTHMKDVWSPLHASGMVRYDREFLLRFRDCVYALQKPRNLPDIPDIILEKPIEKFSKETLRDCKPNYVRTAPVSKKNKSKSKSGEPVPIACPNEQSPTNVYRLDAESGYSALSTSKTSNVGLRNISPETISQQNAPGQSNVTFSNQAITMRPPLPYQVPVAANPQPMFESQRMKFPRTIMYPYTTQQQLTQNPNFRFGVPHGHQGSRQFLPLQFRPMQLTSSGPIQVNQPPLMGNETTNDQRPKKGQINKPREKKHILSIIDPNSGKDVTAEFFKTTEAIGYQDTASKSSSAEMSKVGTMLIDLIVRRNMDNEAAIDWIDSNVDAAARERPQFIRALMTVVCNSAIKGDNGKEKLEVIKIIYRDDLLQRYLGHNSELELQALYAVQALITQLRHPPGVIRHIFETLYDEDIIGEDAFSQWQVSEDEPNGKVECLRQLTQFFYWLKEANEEEDY